RRRGRCQGNGRYRIAPQRPWRGVLDLNHDPLAQPVRRVLEEYQLVGAGPALPPTSRVTVHEDVHHTTLISRVSLSRNSFLEALQALQPLLLLLPLKRVRLLS